VPSIAYDIYNKGGRIYLSIHATLVIQMRFTKYIFRYTVCALNYLGQRISSICDSVYYVHNALTEFISKHMLKMENIFISMLRRISDNA